MLNLDISLTDIAPRRVAPAGTVRKLLRHAGDNEYIMEMDWSSLTAFLTCDRAAEYRLVFSRSTYPSAALIYGQAIHAALEVWYKFGCDTSDETRRLMAIALEKPFLEQAPQQGEWRTYEHAISAIDRYLKKYSPEHFSVVSLDSGPCVEQSFALPLSVIDVNADCPYPRNQIVIDAEDDTPFRISKVHIVWTGIIDLVAKRGDLYWIVDHKTASRTGPSYFRGFDLSQQLLGYVYAAQRLFHLPIGGACLNVLVGRQQTKTGTAWEQERDYKIFPEARVNEWPRHITSILEDFLHHLTSGFFPMKTEWCNGKYGACPFLDVCSMTDDLHRMTLLMSDAFAPNVWQPLAQSSNE